jgi:general secretion pathway protein M
MVTIGAAVLALMLGYALVWYPAQRSVAKLEATLPRMRMDLNVMQRQSTEIARWRQSAAKAKLDVAGALAAVQATAAKRGLGTLDRVETMGTDRVRVVLVAAAFEPWLAWVDQLQREHQLVIDVARIDAIERPGFAKIEMVLYLPNAR